jgi:hypothetical protein
MIDMQQCRSDRRFCLAGHEKAFKAAGEAVIKVEVRFSCHTIRILSLLKTIITKHISPAILYNVLLDK